MECQLKYTVEHKFQSFSTRTSVILSPPSNPLRKKTKLNKSLEKKANQKNPKTKKNKESIKKQEAAKAFFKVAYLGKLFS